MAASFSSDDKARMLLAAFKHHGLLAGETLRGDRFAEFADRKGWDLQDLEEGLLLGVTLGWFQAGAEDGARLTPAGFQALRSEVQVAKRR
jgi:hypothetical protein